ncbi:hypothetical protein BG011_006532 [Mortierella polycephala]|uniref:Arrestin-like N-terminal domain-containing protein n=1 Tax=Mortierella polycephala TaxID=41804 RepID=A0A9P6PT87_9FUNG|nr:hypothetical protein BG011_006532 [Mortierella polycephala]
MKKLSISLVEDGAVEHKGKSNVYLPGDSMAGHLSFNTSSSIKYTCIKIRFVGLVSTKVAKTAEEIYVLNQQTVLFGNPNNTEEAVLPEGKHSWPFEFMVPSHHIPSSGKYRHGMVKYTLTAIITSKTFLGGMQELKANHTVQLKDLINCALPPYSASASVLGSSNTKPVTNKAKNLITANVQLASSAHLAGQQLSVALELTHPKKIHRDPGCWIQLIRKEHYYGGDHVVASATKALVIDSDSNTARIEAELAIPSDAYPTMITTKIISIQYHLLVLLDMRARTGFMESKLRKNISKKQRTKLLALPGGFEVQVPVVIGTVSDVQYSFRVSPFAQDDGAAADRVIVSSDPNGLIPSVISAASQLSLAPIPNGTIAAMPANTRCSPGMTSPSRLSLPSPKTPTAASLTSSTVSNSPKMQVQIQPSNPGSYDHNTLRSVFGGQASGSTHRSTANMFSKPLPSLPSATAFTTLSPQAMSPHYPSHPQDSSSSTPSSSYMGYRQVSEDLNPSNSYGYPKEKAASSPPHQHLQIQLPLAVQVQFPTAPQAVALGMGPASPGAFERRTSQRFSLGTASPGPVQSTHEDYFQVRPNTPPAILKNTIGAPASAPYMPPPPNTTPPVMHLDLHMDMR